MNTETSKIEAPSVCDIAFVGSGLSSSATLIQLVGQLRSTPLKRPIRVAVIEKSDQFFTGVPYGERSGSTSLTITPVDEFLPSPMREDFMTWLAGNYERVVHDVEMKGGALSQDLLDRCKGAIAAGDCSEFHVPRYFFGAYLIEKVRAALDDARECGHLDYQLVQNEVMDIQRHGDGYQLQMRDGAVIESGKVVLALGTAPNRNLFDGDAASEGTACLIDDPYAPNLEATMERIIRSLKAVDDRRDKRIVIIGANASGLEMLYTLNNEPALEGQDLSFRMFAPQGKLPDRFVQIEAPRLETVHLNALGDRESVTAAAILAAVKADLADAKQQSLGIADTLPRISAAVGALVGRLSLDEKQIFVRHVGIEIGRLQRRAGEEYSDIAEDLMRAGRLELVAGWYTGLESEGGGGVGITFKSAADGEERTLPETADVVINCSGSAGLSRPNPSPLIERLLTSGLCSSNPSGAGFVVNDKMEAADDIYVIGPLLAGNIVQDLSIWHVEHCGRIIGFSKRLAKSMHDDLCNAA